MERRGGTAAAFIPLHKALSQLPCSESYCAAAAGSCRMITPCRKAEWRVGRAAEWEAETGAVKDPCAVTASSSGSWLGRQKGTRLALAYIDSFHSVLE